MLEIWIFRACYQVTFRTDFRIEIWTSGLQRTGARMESIAKNNFPHELLFMDIGIELCRLLEALGAFFLIFVALETGLKIDGFPGVWQIQSWAGDGSESLEILGL